MLIDKTKCPLTNEKCNTSCMWCITREQIEEVNRTDNDYTVRVTKARCAVIGDYRSGDWEPNEWVVECE